MTLLKLSRDTIVEIQINSDEEEKNKFNLSFNDEMVKTWKPAADNYALSISQLKIIARDLNLLISDLEDMIQNSVENFQEELQ